MCYNQLTVGNKVTVYFNIQYNCNIVQWIFNLLKIKRSGGIGDKKMTFLHLCLKVQIWFLFKIKDQIHSSRVWEMALSDLNQLRKPWHNKCVIATWRHWLFLAIFESWLLSVYIIGEVMYTDRRRQSLALLLTLPWQQGKILC